MPDNNVIMTEDEVAMNVAHIEGKINELRNARASFDTVDAQINSGSAVQAVKSAKNESYLAVEVMKRVMGRDDN